MWGTLFIQIITHTSEKASTEGEHVLVGLGENAGVIDVGDDIAIAIRMRATTIQVISNHIKAQQQALGGSSEIFYYGARPIAIMDPLRFGP